MIPLAAICTAAALAAVQVPVVPASPAFMVRETGRSAVFALWAVTRSGAHRIYIMAGLPEPWRSRLVEHEKCHEIAGAWHE